MRRDYILRSLALAASLALGACALKAPPDRAEIGRDALTNARVPDAWTAGRTTQGEITRDWIRTFGDPRLDALVREALEYNTDLRAGAARVEQAEGALKIAGAALGPAVDALGRANKKFSGGGGSDLTGVIISASWEVDVWGRIRYGQRAAQGDQQSIEADLAYARQSIAALVAKSWFLAAEAALQRQLALEMVTASDKNSELARTRVRVGSGDDREVALSDASLQAYRDTLRQLDLAREQASRALELLLGRYPAAALATADALPALPAPVAAGVPSEVLERRPDVIAAERRVTAAFDRVQEARMARLPRISLGAGLAWIHSTLFVLKTTDNPGSHAGVTAGVPLLDGGAREAQVEARIAEQKRAVADYAATGLKAFNEVESALASEAALVDREKVLSQAVTDNERSLSLGQVQFRVGKIDLRTVLTDQLALYGARVQLIKVRADALAQRVNLHLALGAGVAPNPVAAASVAP